MAILRSSDGKFYDVDDNALAGKEVKSENLPKDLQDQGPPEGGGGGLGALSGLIQIIVNVPPGGAGGGAPAPQGAEGADVEGHGHHHHGGGDWDRWFNYWRNCWRNYQWRNHW